MSAPVNAAANEFALAYCGVELLRRNCEFPLRGILDAADAPGFGQRKPMLGDRPQRLLELGRREKHPAQAIGARRC